MKENTRKTISIYYNHAKKFKISGLIVLLSVVGASVINVVLPLYYKKFFDILTLEGSVAARNHIGGTAPNQVRSAIKRARQRIQK